LIKIGNSACLPSGRISIILLFLHGKKQHLFNQLEQTKDLYTF